MFMNVYKIIDKLESSNLKKKLDNIKLEIQNNLELQNIINNFNNAKELYEKYNIKEDYIKAKKDLLQNKIIKEYINIQNEINMLTIHINSKIKQITSDITKK